MRQATTAAKLFDQIVAETPPELKKQLDMSFAIADKLDATLKERGMNQKEFAHIPDYTKGRGYHHGYSRYHVNANKLNYTVNRFTSSATEILASVASVKLCVPLSHRDTSA